ncbi:Conserved hypothetical protein [gamma proteobacterium HdN1]|nr:Conserved hypothetical protein [gamma proteobacterium HdN1]
MSTAIELPIVLDVEASGFGRGSYPIEVGIALPNGDLHAWLIKPLLEWVHWQEEAEQVHGISRERLQREGMGVRKVAMALNHMLAGKTVYTDGWGVDRPWLALLFEQAELVQKFRLESIFVLLNQAQLESWAATRAQVLAEGERQAHRAGTDAQIVQTIYRQLAYPSPTSDAAARRA